MRLHTSRLPTSAPCVPATSSERLRNLPRHRLMGGDRPLGGVPAAVGHAGRMRGGAFLGITWTYALLFALISLCVLVATPRSALAGITVTFANGGTAEMGADGTLFGSAYVGDWDDDLAEHFPITMPDGASRYGWCMATNHFAPAPGYYPFTATPNAQGSYDVYIDTSDAKPNPRQLWGQTWLSPAQPVGNFTWSPVLAGRLKLVKDSNLPDITLRNSQYSLEGAVYGVWKDEACTQPMGDDYNLVVGADGTSNEVQIAPGTYWVKEKTAPAGYRIDVESHRVSVVTATLETLHVSDTPLYDAPSAWATKYDAQYTQAQGSSTLEGAEFTIRYYDGSYTAENLPERPTRSWVVRSDAQGIVMPSTSTLVRGSALYTDAAGNPVFPLGTVTVQETKAPTGYWLEGQNATTPTPYSAPIHVVRVSGDGSYQAPGVPEYVRRAGISLKKHDAQIGAVPQGEASLAGISFIVVNKTGKPVVVGGNAYADGDQVGSALVTDDKGNAATPADYLPLGTYEVREIATNDSMTLTSQPQTVTLTTAHTNTVVAFSKPFKDEVVRGGIAVGKISHETGMHLPQGAASLAGAEFEITLQSERAVVVGGTIYTKGQVVTTLTTNEQGLAQTDANVLPYATYRVRETKPPTGFLPNTSWKKTVTVRKDGMLYDLTAPADSVDDQVIRGGFYFNKADESTMARMANVAWRIRSTTTGESHVVVSDENGIVDTEDAPHTQRTNANDKAVNAKGVVDDAKLDSRAGLWFSGSASLACDPNNDLCALPYDTYEVEELRCAANEGRELVTFTVSIHRHDKYFDLGTIDDKTPQHDTPALGTTLCYVGSHHVAPAAQTLILQDEVAYEGLTPGEEYVLVGELVLKETGHALRDASGETVSARASFVPTVSQGHTTLTFTFDATSLAGSSVVAFEHLFKDGVEITAHADIEDEGQTVAIPALATTLGRDEEASGEHSLVLQDTVHYENLVPYQAYELHATLMDKDSASVLVDEHGGEIRGSAVFVPEGTSGEASVRFYLEPDSVAGKTLVCFERLFISGLELAVHEDWEDENQTLAIPRIETELTDVSGRHVADARAVSELVDTVTYSGLTVGKTYELVGSLQLQDSGEALCDQDGNPITARASFEPQQSSGTAVVTFTVDGALLSGHGVVAFEELYQEDLRVAVHANIEDETQTVWTARIGTQLMSAAGTHEVGGSVAQLLDTVTYEGLCPHQTYTLVGRLMDRSTGKTVLFGKGEEAVSSVSFEPESSMGTVEVPFEFDASELTGKTLVAFEYLYEGSDDTGREIAAHADLEDTNQSVCVPRIGTSATDASDNDKTVLVTNKARVLDTVSYEGLEPGAEYLLNATLYDKSAGQVLLDATGKPYSAQCAVVPAEQNGTTQIKIRFDATNAKGKHIVVFESLTREGVEVARHTDPNDADQTIQLKKPTTPAKPTPPDDTPVQPEKPETPETPTPETPKKPETPQTPQTPATPQTNPTHIPTPTTGEADMMPVIAGCALLGAALLTARRFL